MKYLIKTLFASLVFGVAALASGQSITDYGDVINVTPRIESFVSQRQICDDTPTNYQSNERNAGNYILGGISGAIVGNQIGGGNGKTLATVAGALLGANAADNRDNRAYQQPRCRWENYPVERQSGFNVSYMYMGRQFNTVTSTNPGNRIRLQINITPITSSW